MKFIFCTHVYRLWDDSSSAEWDEARQQQAESSNEECGGHQQEQQFGGIVGVGEIVASEVVGHDSQSNGAKDLKIPQQKC